MPLIAGGILFLDSKQINLATPGVSFSTLVIYVQRICTVVASFHFSFTLHHHPAVVLNGTIPLLASGTHYCAKGQISLYLKLNL